MNKVLEHVAAGGDSSELTEVVQQAFRSGEFAGSATRIFPGKKSSPTQNLVTKEPKFKDNEYNVSDILLCLKNGSGSDAPGLGIHVAQCMVYAHNMRKLLGGHTRFNECIQNMLKSRHMYEKVSALHCYDTLKDILHLMRHMTLKNMNESHVEISSYAAGGAGPGYSESIISFAVNKFGEAISPLTADREWCFYKKGNVPVETMLKVFEGFAVYAKRRLFFRRVRKSGVEPSPLTDEERQIFVLAATSVGIATSGASIGWLRKPLIPFSGTAGTGIGFRFDRHAETLLDIRNLYISEPEVSF
jgi:hypothetical protein